MASDPIAVVLLLGMGYDSLSMNASSLPRIKWLIRQLTFKRAKKLVNEVLKMENPVLVRHRVEMVIEKLGVVGITRAGR